MHGSGSGSGKKATEKENLTVTTHVTHHSSDGFNKTAYVLSNSSASQKITFLGQISHLKHIMPQSQRKQNGALPIMKEN